MSKGFQKPVKTPEKKNSLTQKLDFLQESFLKNFESLNDPRIDRSKDHLLIDIVAISILAVISGAEGWVAIEIYGKAKYEWLKNFLELPNGIPSHDTFSRVWARIEPSEFEECFQMWVNSITEKIGVEIIAIDGKTLRQSYDRSIQQKALHIVSAWSSSHQLVLGQKKVNPKSNEITAIPALIEMLEIEGSIITIDAMGCQKEITSLICKKKGDYIIALKANQKYLYQEIKGWFEMAEAEGFKEREYSHCPSIEIGHHPIEKREIIAVSVSSLPCLHNQSLWSGLKTVVMVKSERKLWNKTTTEVRFYISSVEKDAQKIGAAIRSHWGIENSLHWTLDVTFSEDDSRIRKGNAPENFALLRRFALNLLKQEKSFKESLKMKRYKASIRWQQAYDKDYYYTGNINKALPLPTLLTPFLEWSKNAIDSRLNGVLVNWYEGSQKHYIGKHQDSTIGLIDGTPIVTISLGQTRIFRLRSKLSSNYKDFMAENRGVFIMPYETNEYWTHEVPHFSKNKGRRISITLRAFV